MAGRGGPAPETARLIFDANPHPMWIFDRETLAFLAVNDAACAAYGYARDEFLRMTIRDIRPREDLPRLTKQIAALGEGLDHAGVWRHRRKDGAPIDVDISVHAITWEQREARLVLAIDVTEKRRAEGALRESERQFKALAEVSPVGVLRTDARGGTIYVNERSRALFGPEAAVADGASWTHAVVAEDRERVEAAWSLAVREGVPVSLECRLAPAGGAQGSSAEAVRVFAQTATLCDESGRIEGHVGTFTDVTERHRLEVQLMQSQKLEAVGRLAGGIAHDFNNLLTAIVGYAGLGLVDLPSGHPSREPIALVLEAADRAAALVRQLLGFARKQPAAARPCDLNDVVARATGLLRRLIGEDVELELALAADLWTVRVDAGQFEQVLMNLAVNARDAMPGGGALLIETRNVALEREDPRLPAHLPPGDYVQLAVRDNGVGMDPATLARVFEPFFTTKDTAHGTGLGLAVCHGIVHQNRGHIALQTAPGTGTTVRVFLPRCDEPLPAAATVAPGAEDVVLSGTETVLVAEDDPLVRELAARTLEQRGYTVLQAADGEAALSLADAFQSGIDLLITDLVMPQIGGRALAAAVHARRPHMRVLFVSGYTSDPAAVGALWDDGKGFLRKPYTTDELARAVRKALA